MHQVASSRKPVPVQLFETACSAHSMDGFADETASSVEAGQRPRRVSLELPLVLVS
jgi:hypothetical protein